ncbi:hypothetical protein pb186bvf_011822 [Paramecium bursaria]
MNFKYTKPIQEKVQYDEASSQVEEIDEIAETILDCIMNNHYISKAGQQYVEDLLHLKPYAPNCLKVDLYEKTEKDKISKFLLVFKTNQAAKNWDQQSKHMANSQYRPTKKSEIFENVLYIFTDGGKQLSTYLEFISEYIEQQPVCILQHSLNEKALYDSKSLRFYYQVHWQYKGHLPNTFPVGQSQSQEMPIKRDDYRYTPPPNYFSKIETKINEDERRQLPYDMSRSSQYIPAPKLTSDNSQQAPKYPIKIEKPSSTSNSQIIQLPKNESKNAQKQKKIEQLTKQLASHYGDLGDLDLEIQFNL